MTHEVQEVNKFIEMRYDIPEVWTSSSFCLRMVILRGKSPRNLADYCSRFSENLIDIWRVLESTT